jgi:ATP-dependent exoDNAse (exonuclease V) beta subunit
VVHLALEELSLRDDLPAALTGGDLARWRLALQQHGLFGEPLENALASVQASVEQALDPEGQGRWILSSHHPQARSEWALSRVDAQGRPGDMIIDRSFIDADSGIRWLVDYKNSRPEPDETLDAFLEREREHYREQLLRYRDALREIGPEELRCALYFPALGHLHHIAELDLPAQE